jgi:hypothetical protein
MCGFGTPAGGGRRGGSLTEAMAKRAARTTPTEITIPAVGVYLTPGLKSPVVPLLLESKRLFKKEATARD